MNKIEELLKIEVPGLVEVITNNTSDYYIKNYAKLLNTCRYPDDLELIGILTTKLLKWYDMKQVAIESQTYMYNKKVHDKSVNLLNRLNALAQKSFN